MFGGSSNCFFLWCDIFSVGFRDFVVCIRGSLFVLWHGVKGGRGGVLMHVFSMPWLNVLTMSWNFFSCMFPFGVDACFFYALD